MIRRVVLRRFKRFAEIEIPLGEHVVFAGPNNSGKTTVLQAIAAWSLAFSKWHAENRFVLLSRGSYVKAHLTRQAFSSVPLRGFGLLWNHTNRQQPIEIELQCDDWSLAMRFEWDNKETVTVRPKPSPELTPELLRSGISLQPVYVAPMSGIQRDEPAYDLEMQQELLGQGKTGDVLRNLLVEAHKQRWDELSASIKKLFGYTLAVPRKDGAYIEAGYHEREGAPHLDIASAGSGFLQVLLLLSFLYTHPGSVLLIDEPDAHLHWILQGVIYNELQRVAAEQRSQLVIATHSEVIIDEAELPWLRVLTGSAARLLTTKADRATLKSALKTVTQADIVATVTAPGVLYVEGHTDHRLLLAWASALSHPAEDLLRRVLVKFVSGKTDDEPVGAPARTHYEALSIFFDVPLRALEIIDGDNKNRGPDDLEGAGLKRFRWRRYEVESYLIHPRAIQRFIAQHYGDTPTARGLFDPVDAWFDEVFRTHEPADFVSGVRGVEAILRGEKARGEKSKDDGLLTTLLSITNIRLHYRDYDQIAARMLPEDIHPEVIERLDAIVRVFTPS